MIFQFPGAFQNPTALRFSVGKAKRGFEAAGGRVDHLGMPVDPGNLLLLGQLGDLPVIGAPGCARSPKENGFDWVLHRLLAGLAVTRSDVTALGVGGLLMEIVSRPQPRSGGDPADEDA